MPVFVDLFPHFIDLLPLFSEKNEFCIRKRFRSEKSYEMLS